MRPATLIFDREPEYPKAIDISPAEVVDNVTDGTEVELPVPMAGRLTFASHGLDRLVPLTPKGRATITSAVLSRVTVIISPESIPVDGAHHTSILLNVSTSSATAARLLQLRAALSEIELTTACGVKFRRVPI